MARRSSPGRVRYKLKRAEIRAADPAVQARAIEHGRKACVRREAKERAERANADAEKLAQARAIAETIHG